MFVERSRARSSRRLKALSRKRRLSDFARLAVAVVVEERDGRRWAIGLRSVQGLPAVPGLKKVTADASGFVALTAGRPIAKLSPPS